MAVGSLGEKSNATEIKTILHLIMLELFILIEYDNYFKRFKRNKKVNEINKIQN